MKISRKLLAVILAALMIVSAVSVAVVSVSAAAGDKVYCRASFAPYCYMWNDLSKENNQQWPGVAMTKVSGETDLYYYTVPADKFDMIIFNIGSDANQTVDMAFPGGNKLFDYAARTWSDYSADPVPAISVTPEGGGFKTSVEVTITVTDADSAYYKIDGGSKKSFTGSTTVTLGASAAEGASIKLDVSATNTYGTTEKSYTFKKRTSGSSGSSGSDGSTSPAIGGNYATNPSGYGARKTITIDGDKSDWEQSMLIAQGVANDDPRVYAHWAMHEIGFDDYAMYAAWDDTNLYIMYEMANVQDIVAPGEDYPMTQGNLWINNIPVFLYIYTGVGNVTHNQTATGTLWNSGTTIDANSDHVVAFSTNASNGPFIYTANDNGELEPDVLVKKGAASGVQIKWGNGKTLSGTLMGIAKAGTDNGRVAGDCIDATLVDFYAKGHAASMDMFYELSIPLANLDITADDIETNGIGVLKVSTFGTSGMDCLPYDLSMADNAAKPYSADSSTTAEKEDKDHITVPMARVGAPLAGGSSQPTGTKRGDTDGDGKVDVFDASYIQKGIAGALGYPSYLTLTAGDPELKFADIDKDGKVDIFDASLIQRYIAGDLSTQNYGIGNAV